MGNSSGGIAGIFTEESKVLAAANRVREKGFRKFDAISPYPIHGMEEALGFRRSFIPYITFVGGIVGGSLGLYFQYWTSTIDWAMNIAGKPFFSLPAYIPITFEMTILFAALSSVAILFVAANLPKVDPPIIDPDLTSHKFAVYIPKDDVGYDEKSIEALFRELGAQEIKRIAEY
jgi:hypothetical protein